MASDLAPKESGGGRVKGFLVEGWGCWRLEWGGAVAGGGGGGGGGVEGGGGGGGWFFFF